MISKITPVTVSNVQIDVAGRFIIVVEKLYTVPVIIVCFYGLNGDDPTFFTRLFSHLPNMVRHYFILGGDSNCVLSPLLDQGVSKWPSPSKSAYAIQLFF